MRNVLLCLVLAFAFPAMAQEGPIAKAQLLLHAPHVKQGEPIEAGVLFTLPPEWHIYWQNPGDSGIPTSLAWTLPEGMTASEIQWPVPERIETSGLVNYGYSDKVILPVTLTPTGDAGGDVTVKADWLVCKDICIPESATLHGTLPNSSPQAEQLLANARAQLPEAFTGTAQFEAGDGGIVRLVFSGDGFSAALTHRVQATWFPVEDGIIANASMGKSVIIASDEGPPQLELGGFDPGTVTELPAQWHGVLSVRDDADDAPRNYAVTADLRTASPAPIPSVDAPALSPWVAMALAFLGGLILNLMPCVLPILSLKALALAKKSGAEQRLARAQGLSYSAGVVLSFLAIAGIMLALRAGGEAIGWGFQLQDPRVIAALFFLMLLVAFNLLGLFTLPVLFGNTTSDMHSLRGAFLTGALAVLLATPCTAPFMAPALGATLTMPTGAALLVFAALGLGMAFPFLLISFVPAARALLPRPGAWMERFKQFLAFPMFATAAWLLWVLNHGTSGMGLVMALAGAVIVAWLIWWAHGTRHAAVRKLALIAAAITIGWCVWMQPNGDAVATDESQVAYSAQTLASLREQGVPVFVDATADWCLTCKVNERLALRDAGIEQLFAEKNITYMVADWTRRDADIAAWLAGFGRNGVPLYVYYPPQGEPVVLPQLLTPALVRDAIQSPSQEPL